MDQSKMSQSVDDDNHSDDLIAELARLMAEDAQGAPTQRAGSTGAPARPLPTRSEFVSAATRSQEASASGDKFETSTTPRFQTSPAQSSSEASGNVAVEQREQVPEPVSQPQSPMAARSAMNTAWGAASGGARGTDMSDSSSDEEEQISSSSVATAENTEQDDARVDHDDFAYDRQDEDFQMSDEPEDDRFMPEEYNVSDGSENGIDDVFSALTSQMDSPKTLEQAWDDQPEPEEDPIAALIASQSDAETEAPSRSTTFDNEPRVDTASNSGRFVAPPSASHFREEPPVFSASRQNEQSRDPLDEIESLIGDAVRKGSAQGLDSPPETSPQQGFDDAAQAAEAAILAASQAAQRASMREPGHRVSAASRVQEPTSWDDRISTAGVSETQGDAEQKQKSGGGFARFVAPVVAAVVLLAVGGGIYVMYGTGGQEDVAAPLLASNMEGAKVEVEPTAPEAEPATSVVASELDGVVADPSTERLVSRDQTDEAVRKIETVDSNSGLANRKVRTVTVRPDGTIVTGDDLVAGAEVLPIERPNVPQLPDAGATATEFQVTAPEVVETAPVVSGETTPVAVAEVAPSDIADTALVDTAAAATTRINPPIPLPRPTNRDAQATANVQNTAPTAPVVTAPQNSGNGAIDLISGNNASVASAAPAPAADGAAAYVQLSSQRSSDAANATLSGLQTRFAGIVDTSKIFVKEVDLVDKGLFFRVLLPSASLADANKACDDIKNAGGDCFVRTN